MPTNTPPAYDPLAHALAVEQAKRRRAGATDPGSSDPRVLWEAAITAHTATGMRRSDAIGHVMREQPALTAAYNAARQQDAAEPPSSRSPNT